MDEMYVMCVCTNYLFLPYTLFLLIHAYYIKDLFHYFVLIQPTASFKVPTSLVLFPAYGMEI